MKPWEQFSHYAGLDWATDHHDLMVLDRQGQIVVQIRFPHSAEGWEQLRQQLQPLPAVAVAIETSHGAAVQQLIAAGVAVYPVNPRSAAQYRQRHTPSGVKDDQRDAWSLADALRVDGQHWRALAPEDPLIAELRLLCRDEEALIEQRTALVNQLQAALREYYPVALEAFADWTMPAAAAFVEAFPTPQALAAAGKRRWEKFLHTHQLARPQTYQPRLECFARATQFCGDAPTTAAKSLLAVSLAKLLRQLHAQLTEYRRRIEQLFAQHPDHDLFGSLPGAGRTLAPRLLAELGDDRTRFSSATALQCHAGTAPISYQSGQMMRVRHRQACNKHLRHTVHLWVDLSRHWSPWAAAYYQAHRAKGQSHACALRCLGQRWLKVLWKMWQSRQLYDPDRHSRNQLLHGSWLLQLTLNSNPKPCEQPS